jgi:hypothetical protein
MSYDDDWPDMTWENRRAMVRKTIHPITIPELKKLGEARFPIVTDPWCIRYFEFLKSHPDGRFYRADVPEHAEIIYCRDSNKGVWFLPEKGMGILQRKGLEIMAEAVDAL